MMNIPAHLKKKDRLPMKLKHFSLTNPQAAALAQLSIAKGMPEAEIIRRALDDYLYAEEKRKRSLDYDEYGPLEEKNAPIH